MASDEEQVSDLVAPQTIDDCKLVSNSKSLVDQIQIEILKMSFALGWDLVIDQVLLDTLIKTFLLLDD